MGSRTFLEAMEDARGVIAAFVARRIADNDCAPAVRMGISELDDALERALEDVRRTGRIDQSHRDEIDQRAVALLMLWSECGERTQALLLDIKTVMARYLTLGKR